MTEIFARIEWILTHEDHNPRVRLLYMHETLVLICHEGVKDTHHNFGNLFAQVDYLCRHHNISVADTIEIQTARRHSNGRDTNISEQEIHYDCRALAILASAVCHCDIPSFLVGRLPVEGRQKPAARHIDYRCLRGIAVVTPHDSTDDALSSHLLVRLEDGDTPRIVNLTSEHLYLKRIVTDGMMLSLTDIHEEDDETLTPRFIVVEPDYLLDITSISSCFTDCGHHPFAFLVNQMKPSANSQAIILGNYAGAFLDSCIHGNTDWRSVLNKHFADDALSYATCPDFDSQQYIEACKQQAKNIIEIVKEIAPHPPKGKAPHPPKGEPLCDSHADSPTEQNILSHPPTWGAWGAVGALLEPSFICPDLGLQGRVDLMSEDMHYLVEQKSGKNYNLERHIKDKHGAYQAENHYVQLLLYFAVLHQNFNIPINKLDIRLMYSRFPLPDGLLVVNYYQQLLLEALKLRNRIVTSAMVFANEGFTPRYLKALTPQTLNEENLRTPFYQRWIYPEHAELLAPLHRLSPLEEAYFCRMATFIYREQVVGSIGAHEGVTRSGADLWNMPYEEKLRQGSIITGDIVSPDDTQHFTLLRHHDYEVSMRVGDSVYLYIYNKDEEPDCVHSILFKGSITALEHDHVDIHLHDPQHLKEGTYAIEPSKGSSKMTDLRALHMLMSAPQERRDLLLGQRPPRFDDTITLSRSYHPDYDAVILRAMQAQDYYLLVGPPGTGKTSMAMRFMVQEHVAHHSPLPTSPRGGEGQILSHAEDPQCTNHISPPPSDGRGTGGGAGALLTSYTNRAIDEICEMLTDAGIDFLRIGQPYSCDPRFRDRLASKMFADLGNLTKIRQRIADVPVVVATTSTLMRHQEILSLKHFSLTIVDEASQILEPSIIGLLSRLGKFILVGDHKQLPAVVQQSEQDSRVTDPLLIDIGLTNCRNSLFERLLVPHSPLPVREPLCDSHADTPQRTNHISPPPSDGRGTGGGSGILSKCGRMHPDVAAWTNKMFYRDENIQPVPLPHQTETRLDYNQPSHDDLDDMLKAHRMLFLDVRNDNDTDDVKSNLAEAQLCADIVRRLHRQLGDSYNPQKSIGIIVPYRNQISLIRNQLGDLAEGITIDTVERYQGSQRDIIIYSFTISKPSQLEFLTSNTFIVHSATGTYPVDRKLNVALTRARKQTIMLGNRHLLSQNPLFCSLCDETYANLRSGATHES